MQHALFIRSGGQQRKGARRGRTSTEFQLQRAYLKANPGYERVVNQLGCFPVDHAVWQRMRDMQEQQLHLSEGPGLWPRTPCLMARANAAANGPKAWSAAPTCIRPSQCQPLPIACRHALPTMQPVPRPPGPASGLANAHTCPWPAAKLGRPCGGCHGHQAPGALPHGQRPRDRPIRGLHARSACQCTLVSRSQA